MGKVKVKDKDKCSAEIIMGFHSASTLTLLSVRHQGCTIVERTRMEPERRKHA